jgi:hypothetical protein
MLLLPLLLFGAGALPGEDTRLARQAEQAEQAGQTGEAETGAGQRASHAVAAQGMAGRRRWWMAMMIVIVACPVC